MRERLVADIPRELAQAEVRGRMLKGYGSAFDYPIESGSRSRPQTTFVRHGAFTR
jgi:adenylate kinase family enzyme